MLTACAASVPSTAPSPTIAPTPVITPDPHLSEPASADTILRKISSAGLPLTISNAIGGDPASAFVKRFNAAIDNWPLIVTEYKSSATLRAAIKWDPSKPPAANSAPYTFVGLNILITFGPAAGKPAVPDTARQALAKRLVDVLDPLLWPIEQRSVSPVPSRTAAPVPSPTVTPKPAKTPKPSAKP
jgi:hypothetical protein